MSNGTNTSPFSCDLKVADDIPTKPATSSLPLASRLRYPILKLIIVKSKGNC